MVHLYCLEAHEVDYHIGFRNCGVSLDELWVIQICIKTKNQKVAPK